MLFLLQGEVSWAKERSGSAISGTLARALDNETFARTRLGQNLPKAWPVTIRMASKTAMRSLRATPPRGMVAHGELGLVLAARCSRSALQALQLRSDVLRIELDAAPRVTPPMAFTAAEVQATLLRREAPGGLTGQGVLIADIDTGVDVFHPAFFRSSEVYFSWIDVDGDKSFAPGIDAVDLDGDGMADADEKLGFADRRLFVDASFLPIDDSDNQSFEVGDTLFVDANGNGLRDYGPESGFDDSSATLGELLLLVDDVDGNGKVDLGEKLVALGPSKIRAVFDGEVEYTRGLNLSAAPGRTGFFENHGSMAAGVMIGGDALHGDMVGIAPNAELLVGVYDQSLAFSELLLWAVDSGAQVILHEYAPWTGYHLDGSSNYELMLDAAAAQGVVHINPVGNLGGSRKHARLSLPPQGSQTLNWRVPGIGVELTEMTILWRNPERALAFSLRSPAGDEIDLGSGAIELALPGGGELVALRDDSSAGTAMFDITIVGAPQAGDWQLLVQDGSATDLSLPDAQLSLFVFDDRSGWSTGVRFESSASEEHLLCFPSTASSAIGVAAYTGHDSFPISSGPEQSGENRDYSGRGTRIDGEPVIAISAPDNPLVATNEREFTTSLHTSLGDLAAFSGTSGASAHVAGAAALMLEADPELTPAQLRDKLRAGAQVDAQVVGNASHTAAQLWGAGKLRIYSAIHSAPPAVNSPPTIEVAQACAPPGQEVALEVQLGDAEDARAALRIQFDDDYDGQWDDELSAPGAEPAEHLLRGNELGLRVGKMRVVDSQGASAQSLVRLLVATECPTPPTGGDDAGTPEPPSYPADCGCANGSRPAWDLQGPLSALVLVLLYRRNRRKHTR